MARALFRKYDKLDQHIYDNVPKLVAIIRGKSARMGYFIIAVDRIVVQAVAGRAILWRCHRQPGS